MGDDWTHWTGWKDFRVNKFLKMKFLSVSQSVKVIYARHIPSNRVTLEENRRNLVFPPSFSMEYTKSLK